MQSKQNILQTNQPAEPAGRRWPRLNVGHTLLVVGLHLIGLLGFWYGPRPLDLVLFFGMYLLTCLGIGMGYHRLLTHRGYKCGTAFRRVSTWLGGAALQGGPARWVATHRLHHQTADRPGDPHSPTESFLYGHLGWVMAWTPRDDFDQRPVVPDVSGNDPWMRILDNGYFFLLPWVLSAGLCFAVAGWRGVLWGAVIRTLALWHVTWCVNSFCHRWGSRPNQTKDESRNLWWVALLTLGEGWHNNHHARPTSAVHGWRWYQVDISGILIRLLAQLGVLWDVVYPPKQVVQQLAGQMAEQTAGYGQPSANSLTSND